MEVLVEENYLKLNEIGSDFKEKLDLFKDLKIFKQQHYLIKKSMKKTSLKINKYFGLSTQKVFYSYSPNIDNLNFLLLEIENIIIFLKNKISKIKLLRENSGRKIFQINLFIDFLVKTKKNLTEFLNSNYSFFTDVYGKKTFTIFQIELYLEEEIKKIESNFENLINIYFS